MNLLAISQSSELHGDIALLVEFSQPPSSQWNSSGFKFMVISFPKNKIHY